MTAQHNLGARKPESQSRDTSLSASAGASSTQAKNATKDSQSAKGKDAAAGKKRVAWVTIGAVDEHHAKPKASGKEDPVAAKLLSVAKDAGAKDSGAEDSGKKA